MIKLPVVGYDIKIQYGGLSHNDHDGNKAQESVVENFFVAHAVGRLGPVGRPRRTLISHVDSLAPLVGHGDKGGFGQQVPLTYLKSRQTLRMKVRVIDRLLEDAQNKYTESFSFPSIPSLIPLNRKHDLALPNNRLAYSLFA